MWLSVIMMLVLSTPLWALAQAAKADKPDANPTQPPEEKLPEEAGVPGVDWGDARIIYDQITKWVAQGKVDDVDPLQAPPMHLVSDLGGIRVTLRWMGKAFGMGDSVVPLTQQDRAKKSDLLHHARVATSNAIHSLKLRLPQWARLPLEKRPQLMVDLQIARCAKPVPPLAANHDVNVRMLLSPDAQGLILLNADRKTAWSWPATTLAMNLSPTGMVKGMLLELGRKPSLEISLLDKDNPVTAYRFDAIHLVQPMGMDKPVRLVRGVQVLDPVLDHKHILSVTWQQTNNLVHRHREDGNVARSYEPTSNHFTLEDADFTDQAMTAYAISSQMCLALKQCPDWDGYAAASKAVHNSITYLLSQLNDHMIRREPTAAAWTLITLIQEPTLVNLKQRRDELGATLAATQQADGHFTQRRPDANGAYVTQTVTPFGQALVHLALLKQFDQKRDEVLLPVLQQSAVILHSIATKQSLMAIATLFEIQQMQKKLGLDMPIPMDQDMIIKQTRALLLDHQVTQTPALGPADVIGGFDLGRKSDLISPAPDWRSAYGVSLLATILKDSTMRPLLADRVGLSQTELLLRGALAARFIVQLTFTPEEVFYSDSPVDCIGGVRQSPWNNALTLRATALGLISLQQFHDAVMQSLQQTQ